MKTSRAYEALQHIDDELVSEAIEFRRYAPSRRLLKICACFLFIALALGIGLFRFGNESDSSYPFPLSAYAISNEETNEVTKCVLEMGQKVPIGVFETESGILGFVFGYDKNEKQTKSCVNIVTAAEYHAHIEEIIKIIDDNTKNYFIYVPAENEFSPYKFTLHLTNPDDNIKYRYQIRITQIDDSYYAELEDVSIAEPINIETPEQ